MGDNRVLVVNDDARSCQALVAVLSRAKGWDASGAGSVAEAIARLDPPPHCILLELPLPDGTGGDVIRHVREAGLTPRLVVLAIPGLLDEAKALGPDALLVHPWEIDRILAACEPAG